jgi:hypothetical protein
VNAPAGVLIQKQSQNLSNEQTIFFLSIQSRKKSVFRSFACPFHNWRNPDISNPMIKLETIIQRWVHEEGLSREEARIMALEEIEFYEEEAPIWKGPNDSVQEYL